MLNLFKNKTKSIPDFSFLGAEMHTHVLPGVDDGPEDMKTTLQMLRQFRDMGYTQVYATPHINESHFPNTTAEVNTAYEEVTQALKKENIDIDLHLAAEYKTDDLFKQRLADNDLLTIGDKHILIELPFHQPPLDWEEQLFSLQMAGYVPILAHAERFLYLYEHKDKLMELKDRGIEPQLNLLSLTGRYGPEVKKQALRLIEKEAYLWVGSDAHRPQDLDSLQSKLRNKWPKQLRQTQYQRNVEL